MHLCPVFQVRYDFTYDQESKLAVPVCGNIQQAFPFPGVFLWENFVSEKEEKELVTQMDQNIWRESQSGRRKQVCHVVICELLIYYHYGSPQYSTRKPEYNTSKFPSRHLIQPATSFPGLVCF